MSTKMQNAYGYCGIDFNCEITTSVVDGEEQIRYTTYGMRVTDKQGNLFTEIPDISLDEKLVEGLVATCNLGLATVHISDLLEDFLVD